MASFCATAVRREVRLERAREELPERIHLLVDADAWS
jgi:hypothetical protein